MAERLRAALSVRIFTFTFTGQQLKNTKKDTGKTNQLVLAIGFM